MPTSIDWTDSIGATSLANGRPSPADRFSEWTPGWRAIKHESVPIGTGDIESFEFREDFFTHFELRGIPDTSHGLCLRLKRHLDRGGQVTVNTGDDAAHVYTAKKLPGGEVTLRPFNIQRRLFAMVFDLRNTAAGDMVCEY